MKLFKLRGELSRRAALVLSVLGGLFVLLIWTLLTYGDSPVLPAATLPSPGRVLGAFSDLYLDNNLIRNTCLSVGFNLSGYIEAVAISLPVGFLIGLYPFFKGSFQAQVNAIRYIPLTAVTALFIAWFGVGTPMKVHFLALGIIVYLLPIVVQRIYEVNEVYLKTVYTIGATDWQTIRTVYIPSVLSRLSDDIRVLTAISWTYIIVAEGIGSTGGIGAVIWRAGFRQGRMDKVFAMLVVIMIIGAIQDRIFIRLDREFFPHKYQIRDQEKTGRLRAQSVLGVIWKQIAKTLWIAFLTMYFVLFVNELVPFLGDFRPLSYLFADTVWIIHLVMLSVIGYGIYRIAVRRQERQKLRS